MKTLSGMAFGVALIGQTRERIYHGLRHIADHRQPTAHIAIQRAIADRQLAFISRSQHQRAGLIRQRHQSDASESGLQILLGHILRKTREQRRQRVFETLINA